MANEELVRMIQSGVDVKKNMEVLYTSNRALIYKTARKYTGFCDLDDLVQEGYLAMVDAVKAYDSTRGALFSTFFVTVYQRTIEEYLSLMGYVFRIPYNLRHTLKVYRELLAQGLTPGEIAENLGCSLAQVTALARVEAGACSLFAPTDAGGELIDTIAADEEEPQADLSGVWDAVENVLDERRARIVWDLFHEGISMTEEAARLGVSHQAIQQHQQKAFEHLRKSRQIRNLAEMADIDIYGRCGVGYFKATHTSSVEYAVIHRERAEREAEKAHAEWLAEFTEKKRKFFEEYGIG